MIKKIPVSKLLPDMFIAKLDWDQDVESKYQKSGRVPNMETVKVIQQKGIVNVYIDTERGIDIPGGVSIEEVEQEAEKAIEAVAKEKPVVQKQVSTSEEMGKAAKLHNKAKGMVEDAMQKALKGEQVEVEGFKGLANDFIDSVSRNQNALACLSRIREKDAYLLEHSVNVGVLMSILGKSMNLDRQQLFDFVLGALLHDMGKILIPDEILHKPGRLTEEEFELMKKHSTFSRDILVQSGNLSEATINVAYLHHERLDGGGYPKGLKGDQLPLESRMAAVVDVYDAITADRCYHKGMSPTIALKRMMEWTGDHLDKDILYQFIKAIGVYPVGTLVELSSGKLAVVSEANPQDHKQPIVKAIYNIKLNRYVEVHTIDLSKKSISEEIIRAVEPEKYQIQLNDFLG